MFINPFINIILEKKTDISKDISNYSRKETHYGNKYSLINYDNLPSNNYEAIQTDRRDDRHTAQNVYLAGKIVRSGKI